MSDDIVLELVTDDDPEETERLTQALRRELLLIPEVETVRAAPGGPAPDGTRGVDPAAIGALVVTALPTAEVLAKLIGVIRGWLPRSGGETTMKVTVNGHTIELVPSKEQKAALVQAFIDEVSRPAP